LSWVYSAGRIELGLLSGCQKLSCCDCLPAFAKLKLYKQAFLYSCSL